MQRVANTGSVEFTSRLQQVSNRPSTWTPTWKSPREVDDWAEYRDEGFLRVLGLEALEAELQRFWPRRGPQWDGLATMPGGVLLVEAKAHLAELKSSCGAGEGSEAKIRATLDRTKRWAGAPLEADWMNGFYQYANRLAHLRFLRERGVDAHLAFLYFVGDADMPRSPSTESEWREALEPTYAHLGLQTLPDGVASVFLPVSSLASS